MSNLSLYGWGFQSVGQLGVSDIVSRSSPVQVGTSSSWLSVDGYKANFGIDKSGNLYSWGFNNKGQLGVSDSINRSSPIQIGSLNTWASVTVTGQGQAAMAITTNHSLYTWGYNNYGNLGLNDSITRSSPTQIGSSTIWSQVNGKGYQVAAVTTAGSLYAWGYNSRGQLGLPDSTNNRSSPTQVGTLTTWSTIAGGLYHTTALTTQNSLYTWGYNNYGQLGLPDTTYRSSPTQLGTATTWSAIAAGYYHTTALTTQNPLYTWGYNNRGQLGLPDSTNNRSSPTQVGTLTTWSAVSGGRYESAAIDKTGRLFTWGDNSLGAGDLGLGDSINRSSPVQVGSSTAWASVSAGNSNMLALSVTTSAAAQVVCGAFIWNMLN